MADVYRKSICNIAALEAADAHGGCFSIRDPTYLRAVVVKTDWNHFSNGNFLCKLPINNWEGAVLHAPLHRRAWVIQERFLSSRVLHFSKHMMYWECDFLIASEAELFGIEEKVDHTRLHIQDLPLKQYSQRREALDLWSKLVSLYSTAALSYEEDKLVAFAGIAKVMQNPLGSFHRESR